MTKQLPKTSIRHWQRTVGRMILVLFFVNASGTVTAVAQGLTEFVLPRYPELYRRAAIEGRFVVLVQWQNGETTVCVVSHKVEAPTGSVGNPELMIQNITEALSRWRLLRTQEKEFQVKLTFRFSHRASNQANHVFRIREREDGLPAEIVIEVDRMPIHGEHGS